MSARKKSALEVAREKNGNADDPGRKTPVSIQTLRIMNGANTPAPSKLPDDERKKQSSLKKLKKLLGSHSKKKPPLDSSFVNDPLAKGKQSAKNEGALKKSSSAKTLNPKRSTGNPIRSSLSFQTIKDQSSSVIGSRMAMAAKQSGQNGLKRLPPPPPPSTSKTSSSGQLSDSEGSCAALAKRPRLSSTSNPEPKSPPQDQPEDAFIIERNGVKKTESEKVKDLSWWIPSANPFHSSVVSKDSMEEGGMFFHSIIQPVSVTKFFREIWEKKPLLVRRHNAGYNDGWFSTSELDQILRNEKIMFGENIDVVSYINNKRETHNPSGRAFPAVVWDFYQQGCSVRLLNPQTYSRNVWQMLFHLQEYFGCMAGANVYLTPAGSQGFAPHYDDIEAFVLQIEGKKRWRVYEPRDESEVLPRFSSPNFTAADLPPPVLDTVLESGDLLYFPRGYIHQGCTMDDAHSLHLTVSVGQKNTWGDLLEKLVPRALEIAMEEEVDLRRSLPRDYLSYMGVAFSDQTCPNRQNFLRTIEQLMVKLLSYAPVDAACDQMAKRFLEDSLPPPLSDAEKERSVSGDGERWDGQHQKVTGSIELEPETEIKIIRRGCLRLVSEEKVCVYHNLDNARVYHGAQSHCIEVNPEEAEAVEYLLRRYPDHVTIETLPLENLTKKLELANMLYERGLLMTREPLEPVEGEDSASESE